MEGGGAGRGSAWEVSRPAPTLKRQIRRMQGQDARLSGSFESNDGLSVEPCGV
jgi:hypothetical protein